jgi:hypothetical protein
MKQKDLVFSLLIIFVIAFFLPFPFLKNFHKDFLFNHHFWIATSFLKFGILSTMGEAIGLRIKTGSYYQKGFGYLPRFIVWGFLGIGIKMAFVIFASGTPVLLQKYFGIKNAVVSMSFDSIFDAKENGLTTARIITAFGISTFMNLIFAPVFMTLHKITDTHITDNGGTLKGFLTPIHFKTIFPRLNWLVQWDFVFKRTIPFFWIPAHTITFLMPEQYRIVFAAFLGIILGILLAVAAQKGKN